MITKRTRRTINHRPKELERQVRKVHDIICDGIEKKADYKINLPKPKHKTRWCSGFCKICGEHMECVTHLHAESHGYKSAEDFIKAGMYAFD